MRPLPARSHRRGPFECSNGNLTSVTVAGGSLSETTLYGYDVLNRQASETDPDGVIRHVDL